MHQSSSHFSPNPGLPITQMASPLATMPAFDKNGLVPAQASLSRLQQIIGLLDNSLRLPNTPRAFAIYLIGLAIVFAGAFMHVLVAAQIMQSQFALSQLQEEYRALEQQNGELVFRIAHETNLTRLHSRINSMGYVPVQQREYVFKQDEIYAATRANSGASVGIVNAPESSNTASINTPGNEIPSTIAVNTAVGNTTPGSTAAVNNEWVAFTLGGEVTSWKNFWDSLWLPEGTDQSATNAQAANTQAKNTQTTNGETNFWSVWWQQANDQGEKLLDQFRN